MWGAANISLMKKVKRLYLLKRHSILINAVKNVLPITSKVELSTLESGKEVFVMDSVINSGLMVPSMRENGARIELTEKVNSFMSTEISMMDSGQMTKPTGLVYICMLTELNMRECGVTISNMGKESRRGQMDQNMKVNMLLDASMESDNISGMMVLNILESGKKIKFQASAYTHG